jgi:hypothetical protein
MSNANNVNWLKAYLAMKRQYLEEKARQDTFYKNKKLLPGHRQHGGSLNGLKCCCRKKKFCGHHTEKKEALPWVVLNT